MIRQPESVEIRNNEGFIADDNPFQTRLIDESDNIVGVQTPLPVDGDSIYNKDVDFDLSDIGTFSGDLTNIFGDYESEITDVTATNPKTFTLRFKRPVVSNKVGFGSRTGNFSNTKIYLKDLAGTVRQVVDDSDDDTKLTSNLMEFTLQAFIEIVVEFHTADEVKISGMFIPKSQSRNISAIDGIVSSKNSSLTPLAGDAVFTGEQENTKNYGAIQVALYSDVACTFLIEGRATPTSTWRPIDTYEVAAGEDKAWSFQGVRQFIRIKVTNGPDAQSDFDLQTMFKPVYVKPSSHPIGGVVKANDDAELVKAQITGERPDGDFGNVTVTNGNNLKISVEEYDPAVDPIRKDLEGGGKISVGTTAVEVTFTGTPTHSITISADEDNTGLLFVGESNVTNTGSNAITFLKPNDVITLDYDDVDNALYVVSDTASQNFWKGATL